MNSWIAVDLDGTLAEYHGWQGAEHIGAPIALMVDRVKAWLAEGRDVRIFTARVGPQSRGRHTGQPCEVCYEIWLDEARIMDWCLEHIGKALPVTNVKDYGMIELWDDRCKQVLPNTGVAIEDLLHAEMREPD